MLLKPYYDSGAAGDSGGETSEQVIERESTELQTLAEKEAQLDDTQKARLTELKTKYDFVEVDDKGNPITAEQKQKVAEVKTKVDAILAKEEKARTQDEVKYLEENTEPVVSTKSVYELIDEQTGMELNVPYDKEGIKDPNSVEGVALREEVIRAKTLEQYQMALKDKAPRAYSFLMHTLNGGKESDFFSVENEDYSSITIDKDNLAGQERVYRKALTLKGNSPDEIDALVLKAKDSKELHMKATKELEALQGKQQQREADRQVAFKREQKQQEDSTNQLLDLLEEKVTKGFGGIKVPAHEREKFLDAFSNNVRYDRGKFFIVKELTAADLDVALKTEFFGYKKGDLSTVAESKARSMQAVKLKNGITVKIVPKSGTTMTKSVPLGQV